MTGADTSIFSLILSGVIPSHKVYEDNFVYAFLDINPLSRGHTLVIPKEPAPTMDVLSEEAAASLGRCLPKICRAIMEVTGATNYNLIQNNGEDAGQTVNHLHFHIIPRYSDSEHSFVWIPKSIDHFDAKNIAASIFSAVN
jgi:histidine triad (HIT) family protein|tara:strand:- start:917 stop:1339 length:423 start_codon:yes stop_codon:yes gene_type:complete